MDTRTSPHRARIAKTQDALARHGLAALLVPSSDPHLSEYLPERWQGRQWLSGFTGSMGTLVVARDKAALFADSRYWVQAEAELAGSGIELVKIPTGTATHHVDWLAREAKAGETVAVDGDVIGLAAAQQLRNVLERAGVALRTDLDLLAEVWPDRPALPAAPVYEHRAPQAPLARTGKLAQLRVFGGDWPTPDGTGVRDYIHVLDLAQGHVRAIDYLSAHPGLLTVNLGTGRGYSVLEVVRAYAAASGRAVPYRLVPRRPGDVAACYADPSLAARELGWRAAHGLQRLCEDSWRWQSLNPRGFEA